MRLLPILLLPVFALASQYSGTVKDLSGAALPGAKVSMGNDSTLADAEGKWTLSIQSTSVAPGGGTSRGTIATPLTLTDRHLSLAWEGTDLQGRRIAPSTSRNRSGTPIAARTAATSDTLLVTWNGKRLVRLPVSKDSAGIAFVIDTAWRDDFDLPWNPRIAYGSVKDSAGTTYRTVKMDTLIWMAENLATKGADRQGDSLGMCKEHNPDSCLVYGRLYSWPEALVVDSFYNHRLLNTNDTPRRGICPMGWHIPTRAEWTELWSFVDPGRDDDGKLLKSTRGWARAGGGTQFGGGTDIYGFRVLPGEWFNTISFQTPGTSAVFWSLSEEVLSSRERAYNIFFVHDNPFSTTSTGIKSYSYAIRCVKDTH